ncbi:hypothetical protein LEP1GSC125_2572 [Leptospira mayottensis 200901122]|uniref:Uncharacterized protein n=1 Tax=Leptospira mayottensis 200901122 TaxID=1193010 RepID=A0AA87MR74_9LEPT|nr:hypothetical protein LEP1GSC125_2572 [Leptospira mayottensis 200901122]
MSHTPILLVNEEFVESITKILAKKSRYKKEFSHSKNGKTGILR